MKKMLKAVAFLATAAIMVAGGVYAAMQTTNYQWNANSQVSFTSVSTFATVSATSYTLGNLDAGNVNFTANGSGAQAGSGFTTYDAGEPREADDTTHLIADASHTWDMSALSFTTIDRVIRVMFTVTNDGSRPMDVTVTPPSGWNTALVPVELLGGKTTDATGATVVAGGDSATAIAKGDSVTFVYFLKLTSVTTTFASTAFNFGVLITSNAA